MWKSEFKFKKKEEENGPVGAFCVSKYLFKKHSHLYHKKTTVYKKSKFFWILQQEHAWSAVLYARMLFHGSEVWIDKGKYICFKFQRGGLVDC